MKAKKPSPPKDELKVYLVKYEHDGKTWGFQVAAKSQDDARDRIKEAAKRGAIIPWM